MGEKEQFFLKIEHQGMMELENHHCNSNNSGKESSWTLKHIYSLKIPPPKTVSKKGKTSFTVVKPADCLLYQVIKIVTNETLIAHGHAS